MGSEMCIRDRVLFDKYINDTFWLNIDHTNSIEAIEGLKSMQKIKNDPCIFRSLSDASLLKAMKILTNTDFNQHFNIQVDTDDAVPVLLFLFELISPNYYGEIIDEIYFLRFYCVKALLCPSIFIHIISISILF